jgi:hypothetical protein
VEATQLDLEEQTRTLRGGVCYHGRLAVTTRLRNQTDAGYALSSGWYDCKRLALTTKEGWFMEGQVSSHGSASSAEYEISNTGLYLWL